MYPSNFLRNMALGLVATSSVMMIDVDFTPSHGQLSLPRTDSQGAGQGCPVAPQGPQDCKPSTLNFHIHGGRMALMLKLALTLRWPLCGPLPFSVALNVVWPTVSVALNVVWPTAILCGTERCVAHCHSLWH